jgi:hypothetical protein
MFCLNEKKADPAKGKAARVMFRLPKHMDHCEKTITAPAPIRNPPGLRAFVVIVFGLAAIFWPDPSKAEGALAVAISKEGAKGGFAFGLSAGYRTSDEAHAKALRSCRQATEDEELGASCKVIESFSGQCGAVAMDPHDETSGFGWSIAASMQAARSMALSRCRQTAGPELAGACIVEDSRCDVVTNQSARGRFETICKYRGWGEIRHCYTIRVP